MEGFDTKNKMSPRAQMRQWIIRISYFLIRPHSRHDMFLNSSNDLPLTHWNKELHEKSNIAVIANVISYILKTQFFWSYVAKYGR